KCYLRRRRAGFVFHRGYEAEMLSVQDYFPFGSAMPGRSLNLGDYRFGFQGQEGDNEIYGTGNDVSYKYRVEETRLGRFLSVDPLSPEYPWNSPYAFSENQVVRFIELEGAEKKDPFEGLNFIEKAIANFIIVENNYGKLVNESLGVEPTLENNVTTGVSFFSLGLLPFLEQAGGLAFSETKGINLSTREDPGDWRFLMSIPATASPLKVQSGKYIYPEQGRRLIRAVTAKSTEIINSTATNKQKGPVITGVLDAMTGEIFYGQNTGVPQKLHPILELRYNGLINRTSGLGNRPHYVNELPGSHSEINALNKALWSRQEKYGGVSEKELGEFLLHNRALRNPRQGEYIPPRCLDCQELTRGVSVIRGN
ncbi:MAG: YwqJ-related putative deaminase, partial [Bacteroidia bacterium]